MKTIKGTELAGKEFEVMEDGTLKLIKNNQTRYIPKLCELYYYINFYGHIDHTTYTNPAADSWLISHQLVFRTKEECEEYKKFLELLDEYKCDLDWADEDKEKFYLYYNYLSECLNAGSNSFAQTQGAFYFKSRKDIEEFVEKAGEDNIKRFMFDVWE